VSALRLLLAVLVLGSIGWGSGRAVQASPAEPPAPPQRIVSLQPALTEAVCALGACARLVGVDRYSSWPPEFIAQLPVVGGGLDPSIEAIVALRPDVVLLSRSTQAAQRLHALGIRTVALDADTLAEVHTLLQRVGDVLQVPAAQGADALWRRIQSDIDAAATSVPTSVRGVRVYFEVGRGPFAAGPQSFIGAILTRLGAENVVPASLGPFPQLSPEFVLRAAPDVIIQSEGSAQNAPGWAGLQAVQHGRICRFAPAQIDILVRPGPRMAEAAHLLAQCLREKAPRHAP
jgi:iron complex transport system substrate-binding protein